MRECNNNKNETRQYKDTHIVGQGADFAVFTVGTDPVEERHVRIGSFVRLEQLAVQLRLAAIRRFVSSAATPQAELVVTITAYAAIDELVVYIVFFVNL